MRTPQEKLLNPPPGSKIAEARDYGIDLTILAENLKLTPEERLRNNDMANNDLNRLAEAMRKARQKSKDITQ